MKMTVLFVLLVLANAAFGYEAKVTKGQLPATLAAMILKANADTKAEFTNDDFYLIETRSLATSQFQMFVQKTEGLPVAKTAIRIWSNKTTNELILAEMHLDENAKLNSKKLALKFRKARFSSGALKSKKLSDAINKVITAEVLKHDTDNRILGMKSKDQWVNGDLVREVEIRGRRGVHHITISLLKNEVVAKSYIEFSQSDIKYQTFKANVFPIYEEVENTGERLPYEQRDLKFISRSLPNGGDTPLAIFNNAKFTEQFYNPIMAETAIGQEYGFWSEASMRKRIENVVNAFPLRSNDLASGLLLQGKYATINLHPAVKQFTDINFSLKSSFNHIVSWANPNGYYEAKPVSGHFGKTIYSEQDLLSLVPERLPDHNTVSYINSGFDEVQVYYGVTVLMEALAEMGFEDAELSTKPFHAFLYDPDIAMKDNAYYYDNTINFTTYNPGTPNMARDNPTIWHELGHGVMDRLMGPHLGFSGTGGGYGGLSEGMADFVAKIVLEHQTSGADFPGKQEFRIINSTGFYVTNEYHDDGEAYGGVMGDMLDEVIAQSGRQGLYDFSDLTLEAMRLTRNHPSLSPRGWFEHMLYADELGSSVRAPHQFKQIMLTALANRNFAFDADFKPAEFNIVFGDTVLTSDSPASREKPIVPCGANPKYNYDLKVRLSAGDANYFKFPATVKVEFKKGALQGAISWVGEESNPLTYTVNSAEELLTIPLAVNAKCQSVNQPDGSCKDYAYIQVFNAGESKPKAKKRFYLRLKEGALCTP